jgi:hypothetical protein
MVTTLGESVFAAPRKARERLRASPFALSARASTEVAVVAVVVAARATPSVAGLNAASGAQRKSALVAAIAERFAIRIGSDCAFCGRSGRRSWTPEVRLALLCAFFMVTFRFCVISKGHRTHPVRL